MNTNLRAWLTLALGVASPVAIAIATSSGSSTSVATSTVEADDDHNEGMTSSFMNRHKLQHLRHDNHANVGTPTTTTTDNVLWNKNHHLRHLHTTVHGSNVEQTHHRRLQALADVGNNGSPAGNFPLGNCQGDCDNDSECQDGTICFERRGLEFVPGCSGEDNPDLDAKDFCVTKCKEEYCVLHDIGNDIDPGTGHYGKCEGDCDRDSDCAGDLKCFKRDNGEDVPGCVGNTLKNAGRGRDYCYEVASNIPNPTNPPSVSTETSGPSKSPSLSPVTSSPTTSDPTVSPSQSPVTSSPTTSDPTVSPSQSPETSSPSKAPSLSPVTSGLTTSDPTVSPNQSPETSSPSKAPSLSPVTSGLTTSDPTVSPSLSPVTPNPTTSDPTVSPSQSPETSSPSKSPSLSPVTSSPTTSDPTVSPTKNPTSPVVTPVASLSYVYNNGDYKDGYSAANEPYPLLECRGDCDRDSDCNGGLECFKRDDLTPVPGCSGEGVSKKDYCYDPNPAPIPTNPPAPLPTSNPTLPIPTSNPTLPIPTVTPTTRSPMVINKVYEYYTDTIKCDGDSGNNDQGPEPGEDDTVLKFWAYGDAPYDRGADTCIAENGVDVEDPCTRDFGYGPTFKCSSPQVKNTCTYVGDEYQCLQDQIIPYMNAKIEENEAAFIYHCGDFLKGAGEISISYRCNPYSFQSRVEVFEPAINHVIVPGDNDWNECAGYDVTQNAGDFRDLWRELFAEAPSSFNKFDRNFPGETYYPDIERKTTPNAQGDVNPELFFFRYNDIAIFGLNTPSGLNYISNYSPVDINAEWVADRLGNDCSFQSVIFLSHKVPMPAVLDVIDIDFAERCNRILPSLVVKGSRHPRVYCMKHDEDVKRTELTVEAFFSGPLKVSVVRDPEGGGDYFHVEDSQVANSNANCPDFDISSGSILTED